MIYHALFVFLILMLLAVSRESVSHGPAKWIMDNPATSHCCGPDDCRALPVNDVVITRTGYLIKSRGETVPFSEARPSIDHQYWLCVDMEENEMPAPLVCFFAPTVGS